MVDIMIEDLLKVHKLLAVILGAIVNYVASPKTRSAEQTLRVIETGLLECLELVRTHIARVGG